MVCPENERDVGVREEIVRLHGEVTEHGEEWFFGLRGRAYLKEWSKGHLFGALLCLLTLSQL